MYERAIISFGVNVNAFDGVSIGPIDPIVPIDPDTPGSDPSHSYRYLIIIASGLVTLFMIVAVICIMRRCKANRE